MLIKLEGFSAAFLLTNFCSVNHHRNMSNCCEFKSIKNAECLQDLKEPWRVIAHTPCLFSLVLSTCMNEAKELVIKKSCPLLCIIFNTICVICVSIQQGCYFTTKELQFLKLLNPENAVLIWHGINSAKRKKFCCNCLNFQIICFSN